ncbi:MAG: peptidase M23, partial [Mycolicibacterium hassiacum]
MRRILGASASRMCGRVCAVPLIAALLLATTGLGTAQPAPTDDIAALVAQIAEVDQKLQDLGAAIQQKQESVNKAIVDLQKAREDADAAQREVEAANRRGR